MDPITPVSLQQPTPSGITPVSIQDTGLTRPNTELAMDRAIKIQYGLGGVLPDHSYQDIFETVAGGNETALRNTAAANIDQDNSKRKQDFISEALQQSPPPSAEDLTEALNRIKPMDPNSVVEQGWSTQYLSNIDKAAVNMDGFWNEAVSNIPADVAREQLKGSTVLSQYQYATTAAENIQDEISKQGYLSWGWDTLKTLVPGYNEAKLRGNVGQVSFFEGLLGSNLQKQAEVLLSLPYPEFKQQFDGIVNGLKASNPQLAAQFAMAVAGQSTSAIHLSNVFTAVDAVSIFQAGAGIAKLAGRAGKNAILQQQVRSVAKDVVRSAIEKGAPDEVAPAAAGDVKTAAINRQANSLLRTLGNQPQASTDAIDTLTSAMKSDVEVMGTKAGSLSREALTRLKDNTENFITKIKETMTSLPGVERIPIEKLAAEDLAKVYEGLRSKYPGLQNGILDISTISREPVTNTYTYTMKVGNYDGTLFNNINTAKNFAQLNNLPLNTLLPQGMGFYFNITKPLGENDYFIRDFLPTWERGSSKGGYSNHINALIGWLRTPEDTLSFQDSVNRKVATYAQAPLREVAQQQSQRISDLSKGIVRMDTAGNRRNDLVARTLAFGNKISARRQWNEWHRVVDAARSIPDPETGEMGYFFKTPEELQDFYRTSLQRLPTMPETEAYFAQRDLVEFDRMMRNIDVYRNKARLGTESHTLWYKDASGQKISSPSFDAVRQTELPAITDENPATTLVMDGKGNMEVLIGAQKPQHVDTWRKQVINGEKTVLRVYDPEQFPLAQWDKRLEGKRIQYILTDSFDSSPLSFEQVPRRGGGHFDYDYDYYIKQPKMFSEGNKQGIHNWYHGDSTVVAIGQHAVGRNMVKHLEEARRLMFGVGKDLMAAKDYVERNLPIPYNELRSWFKSGRLATDQPFYLVPKNKSVIDIDNSFKDRFNYIAKSGVEKNSFRDGTKSGSLARQYQVNYTGARDAHEMMTIADEGTRNNPLLKYRPADLVDPIATMNRSLNRIITSHYFDDYKAYAVNSWIKEAQPWLRNSESVQSAPMWHFNNPHFLSGAPPEIVNNLKANQFKIQQFLGVPSSLDKWLYNTAQSLSDVTYDAMGPKAALIPEWLIPRATDPFRIMRSFVYHTTLGLFSLPSMITQQMTWVNIYALSPRSANGGGFATWLHQAARLNQTPGFIAHLDNMATKLKFPGLHAWKPGEFKEAWETLNKTGFANVAGEVANIDDNMAHKFITGEIGDVLKLGQVPFKEGLKHIRIGAWYTSFLEFKRANPEAIIGNKETNLILQKADMYHANMSRAANSTLNSGAFSVPMQFLTYKLRMLELFMGKRLGETVQERTLARARLFGAYSLAFGVPTAMGLTGLPSDDWIRSYELKNGYVPGQNYVKTMFNEGIPSFFAAMVSGDASNPKNYLNISDRYAHFELNEVQDLLNGDVTWWKLLSGASGQKMADVAKASSGFYNAMISGIKGDGRALTLTGDAVVEAAKTINSFSNSYKAWTAIHTGNWYSKNTQKVAEGISPMRALVMGVTGLAPQEQADMHLMQLSMKSDREAKNQAEKLFQEYFNKSLIAGSSNNPQQAKDYLSQAYSYLYAAGIPDYEILKTVARVKKDQSMIGRTDWDYFIHNAPPDRADALREAWRYKNQFNDGH